MVYGQSELRDAGGCAGIRFLAGLPGGGSVSFKIVNSKVRSFVEPTVEKFGRTDSFACSRSLRFRLMAIIRQVRFSMRSWLGNCVFVLL